jgi:hypothetical protein
MSVPEARLIRYRVDPADVPPDKAARRLHLAPERFQELLPELRERGFPPPDPTTGMFDLEAIDLWRKARNPRLYGLTSLPDPTDVKPSKPSMGERFHAAKNRSGNGSAA